MGWRGTCTWGRGPGRWGRQVGSTCSLIVVEPCPLVGQFSKESGDLHLGKCRDGVLPVCLEAASVPGRQDDQDPLLTLLASICAKCFGAPCAAARAFRLRQEHDDERGSVMSRRSHRSARSHRSGRSRRASSSDDDLEVGKPALMAWP